jgi:tetratricopeptide (TPR) repeat protein
VLPADNSGTAVGAAPAEAAAAPAAPRPPARSAVDELLSQPGATAPDTVKLTRTEEPAPRVPPDVDAGYRALVAGDLATARARYAAALAADATSVDALLGLATAEARGGDAAAAALRYRRVLDLDPQNATAAAGLAALAESARPEAVESALRADLARQPASAALHFTLGNLYARQSRWGEAQAEFFEAFRLDPASADIAFNLAVSLDHLGSRKPAADYYRRALAAARGGPRQFDPAEARRRLADLGER